MEPYKIDEIKEHWADYLEDRGPEYLRDMDLNDMHNEAFNESYFIVGTLKAEQWLGDHAFEAIRTIQEYENDNFGEMLSDLSDLSDPERVVNMYAYIIGEQVVYGAQTNATLSTCIATYLKEGTLEFV